MYTPLINPQYAITKDICTDSPDIFSTLVWGQLETLMLYVLSHWKHLKASFYTHRLWRSSLGKAPASQAKVQTLSPAWGQLFFCIHIILLVSNPGLEYNMLHCGNAKTKHAFLQLCILGITCTRGTHAQYPNDLHLMLHINQQRAIPQGMCTDSPDIFSQCGGSLKRQGH